jgi:heat shock protein HtpX
MLPAFGLYSHIQANRRRSIMLLVGLFFLVYAVAYAGALIARALGDGAFEDIEVNLVGAWRDMIYVAPFATIGVLAWIFIAYLGHQKLIDMVTGARAVTRSDDPKLYRMLENLCISRGMTTPSLKIMETDALNAYASGLSEKQYAITLTRGVVDRLDDAEIEAIMAHELTHIRNEDVKLMVIAVVIAGVVSFAGEMMLRSMRFGGMRMGRSMGRSAGSSSGSSSGRGGGKGAIIAIAIAAVIILLAWLLSIVIRFALSRSREYLADSGAVELTKNPDAMISALLKISGRAELPRVPSSVMEMCVENPRVGFTALLSTHPSIEDRVKALEKHAGGRRPPPESLTLRPTPAELIAAQEAQEAASRGEPASDGTKIPLPPGPWGGLPGGDALPGGGSGPWGGGGRGSPWGGGS